MIDLHSHVLPGVDDGAEDLAQAVRMCELSYRDGCRIVVTTPHLRHERYWNDDTELLKRRHQQLRKAVHQRLGDGFEVLLGGEIAVSSESLAELDQPAAGGLLTLGGSSYVLLEPNFHGLGPDPVEMVYEATIAGWRPIIAHPERISWLVRDMGLMAALVDHGALLQVTAMSLTGDFGAMVQGVSRELMDRGWVQFVASDCHDERIRPPGLSAARAEVRRHWGSEAAEAIFSEYPKSVLQDAPLVLDGGPLLKKEEVSKVEAEDSLWRRLRMKFFSET